MINVLSGLIFGYATGIIAYAQKEIQRNFGDISDAYLGLLSACVIGGAMIGALFASTIADKFGRKKTIIYSTFISVILSLVIAASPNIPFFIVFRTLHGLIIGFYSVVCPMYVSEMSPDDKRGALNSLFQVAITFGILVSYLIGYFLQYPRTDNKYFSWRIMLGLVSIPGVFLLYVSLFRMKESKFWKLQRQSVAVYDENDNINSIEEDKNSWKVLFNKRESKNLIVGVVLAVSLQLTGINGIIFYMPKLFEKADLGSLSGILTIVVGAWNFITTFISLFLVDKFGRRPLLLSGLALMALSLLMIAIVFLTATGKVLGWTAFAAIMLFHLGFEMSPGTLFWVIINELFSSNVKTKANSLMNTLNWGFNLCVSFLFPILLEKITKATFFIFFGINTLCLIYLWIFFKETKGKFVAHETIE